MYDFLNFRLRTSYYKFFRSHCYVHLLWTKYVSFIAKISLVEKVFNSTANGMFFKRKLATYTYSCHVRTTARSSHMDKPQNKPAVVELINNNLGQKSVERLNKFTAFYFNFGFCSNSAFPRSPHSMLFSRSLLQVKCLVFAAVSLPQYSLNVNIEWGEGGGGASQVLKMVIVPRLLAKIDKFDFCPKIYIVHDIFFWTSTCLNLFADIITLNRNKLRLYLPTTFVV